MIRINLLPHRELKRRELRQRFYVFSGLIVAAGVAIGLLVHVVMVDRVERQERRNAFFTTEIKKLDTEIAEIRRLREQIDALVARKQVIESLQGTRAQSVHLLNELALQMPEGVYLKSIKQTGAKIALLGYAQSNSRVSHLMRNLDGSPFLEQPGLVEVKSTALNNRRLSEFTLNIGIESPPATEDKGGKP